MDVFYVKVSLHTVYVVAKLSWLFIHKGVSSEYFFWYGFLFRISIWKVIFSSSISGNHNSTYSFWFSCSSSFYISSLCSISYSYLSLLFSCSSLFSYIYIFYWFSLFSLFSLFSWYSWFSWCSIFSSCYYYSVSLFIYMTPISSSLH